MATPATPASRLQQAQAMLAAGARAAGGAAVRIVPRVLGWGALGVLLGVVVFAAEMAAGLLRSPWPDWRLAVWLLLLAYPGPGALRIGHAAQWRGIGRAVIHLGVEQGFVVHALDAILRRADALLRRSAAADRALDGGAAFLRDVPLDRVEAALKEAVGEYARGGLEPAAAPPGVRTVRRFLAGRVERYLLHAVRADRDASGGGGVSLERAYQAALQAAETWVRDAAESKMRAATLVALLLFALACAVAPVALAVARRG
ncbi:MAG: hypothetical protein HY906_25935 [Deltaproteobacteria bacterium]|nr:hypothetical protein [Deltaproteobacteria bacterium]